MLNDYNHCDHLFLVFIHQKKNIGTHTYLMLCMKMQGRLRLAVKN